MTDDDVKDYAVQIKVRNNRLLQRMRSAGHENVRQLSIASGIEATAIRRILNLERSGLTIHDTWRATVLDLATFLRCLPEDIIPPQHLRAPLRKNTAEITMTAEEAIAVMGVESVMTPEAIMLKEEAVDDLRAEMATLSPIQQLVLGRRFGLDGPEETLKEVGAFLKVGSERVRQIEAKALKKLSTPAVKKKLKWIVEGVL